MTRADIIRMAQAVGAIVEPGLAPMWSTHTQLYEFAALVAAAEREECARLCETKGAIKYAGLTIGEQCAAAIRARSKS